MKKIIIGILLLLPLSAELMPSANAESTTSKVIVTEKIPGLDCNPVGKGSKAFNADVDKRRYECTVEGTFGTVMMMLRGLIKYVTFIAVLIVVLLLVISGIKMSIEGKKEDSKKMFGRVIVSLIVLFSMGLILNTIAPWVYR